MIILVCKFHCKFSFLPFKIKIISLSNGCHQVYIILMAGDERLNSEAKCT